MQKNKSGSKPVVWKKDGTVTFTGRPAKDLDKVAKFHRVTHQQAFDLVMKEQVPALKLEIAAGQILGKPSYKRTKTPCIQTWRLDAGIHRQAVKCQNEAVGTDSLMRAQIQEEAGVVPAGSCDFLAFDADGKLCIIERGRVRYVTTNEAVDWYIRVEETDREGFCGGTVQGSIAWMKMIRAALK